MSETALLYKDVVKDYVQSHLGRETRTRGLDGLSLEIRKGEIFGLLGLNGTGKTTTMKLALGLLKITSGSVQVAGRDPGTPEALAKIGYLPELPYFYPYLTPTEGLRFYGSLSGLPGKQLDQRIPEVLKSVGLERAAGRKASGFSKGMLQRLGLAQAILHQPEIIVLDEPVSGLDPLAVTDVRLLLHRLNEEDGVTLLLSSHSISNVENLCHRVGILKNGKMVKIIERDAWSGEKGSLEKMFVETVRPEAA